MGTKSDGGIVMLVCLAGQLNDIWWEFTDVKKCTKSFVFMDYPFDGIIKIDRITEFV